MKPSWGFGSGVDGVDDGIGDEAIRHHLTAEDGQRRGGDKDKAVCAIADTDND